MTDGNPGSLYYQIIHERRVRQWYTGYKIYESEWDAKHSAIILSHDNERLSYLISVREHTKWYGEHFMRIVKYFSENRCVFTADDIIEEFTLRQQIQSFFNFMEMTIVRLKQLGKRRTSETYIAALKSFRRFMNDRDVMFDEFDSDLLESYQAFLTRGGLIPNSISFYMRILRAVYNRAVEKGITEDRAPFRHVYTGIDKTTKRALDLKTLKRLKDVDLRTSPCASYARDMFLLSFFFRGMSFVDMAYLKKTDLDNGCITYRRRKTGQRLVVKWTHEMQQILDKYPPNETEYLLPIITSSLIPPYSQYRKKQYQINRGLKIVAKNIGLNMPLSLYCSRHSWASIAKLKGVPISVISDGLGHDSELTTQIYLSTLDTSAVDNANSMIIKLL